MRRDVWSLDKPREKLWITSQIPKEGNTYINKYILFFYIIPCCCILACETPRET